MGDGAVGRLGVDVSVAGFDKFEQHMNRVNELLGAFAAKATQFSASASTFNNAMQVFGDATKAAAAGLVAFREAARSLSATGKTIGSLTERITKLGAAFASFGTSAPGVAGAIGNIAQNLQGIKLPGAGRGQQLTAQATVREAQLIAERQAEVAEKIRRRFQERQLADEEKAAKLSAKFQAQASSVAERARREQNQQQVKQRGQQEDFGDLGAGLQRSLADAEGKLRGRLADALLNRKDESDIKGRIDSVVGNLKTKFSELQRGDITSQNLQQFKALEQEIRKVTQATEQQIKVQQKSTNQPSVAFLARERIRDQTSSLNAQQFAIGKIAQAANSANPIIRTFARTIFQVEDAAAASRLGFEAFIIVLRRVAATLTAISLPARLLIGLFGGVEKVVQRLANSFSFASRVVLDLAARFAGFRGAPQSFSNLNREVDALSGNFKNLRLDKFESQIDLVGKRTKKMVGEAKKANIEFRELGFDVAAFDPSKFGKAGRGGARPNIAAQGQLIRAQQQIEQQATAQIAQAENVRARIREQIATQSTQRQTEATQARINKLVALEEQASARIQQVEARRTAATARVSGLQTSLQQAGGAGAKAAADLDKTATAIGRVGKEAEQSSKGISGFSAFLAGLAGGAIGNALTNVVRNIGQGVRGLAGDAINALGEFESLEAGFQTLSRREILNSGEVTDFAEAEKLATVRAEELLAFTQKLAIISPFEQADIAGVFRQGLAYEFTSKEAEKLTQITIDYAAATGQSAETSEGIVLALGQVKQAGKLTGQELRQLINRGVPALSIIGKAVGKTTTQLREFIEQGGSIDADLAIGAIAKSLATDFAGAAERTQGTIRGLISSLNDLRKISLRSFVTPIADDVLKPIAAQLVGGLLDQGLQDQIAAFGQQVADNLVPIIANLGEVIGTIQGIVSTIPQPVFDLAGNFILLGSAVVAATTAFAVLGPVFGFIAAAIVPLISVTGLLILAGAALVTAWRTNWLGIQQVTANAVNSILSSIQNLAGQLQSQFGTAVQGAANIFAQGLGQIPQVVADISSDVLGQFGDLLSSVVDFGAGLVEAFASGIVGAVSVVIDALNVLGQVISDFLAPGSPPKLLPDIDKWGTAAANEFLGGFTVADFDLLSDLSKGIETALASATDKLDPETLVKVRETVALAVKEFTETGSVSPAAFAQIAKASGKFAEEISIIAPAYFSAAAAAKELEKAQEQLNDVSKKYERLLAPIEARLKGIEDATAGLDEERRIKQLQNVLDNRFATEEQKRSAALELEQIAATQEKRNLENARDGETKLAQTRVDSAEEQKKAADTQLELLQRRLGFETDILKAMNAQGGGGGGADAAEKKAKKLKEKLGELTGDITSLADLELPEINIEKKLEPVIQGFVDRLEEGRSRITAALDGLRQDIVGRFTSLRDAFVAGFQGITLTPTANSISDQLRSTGTDALGQFANKLGLFAKNLAGQVDAIQKEFARLQGVFNAGFGAGADGAKGEEQLTGLDALVFKAGKAASSLSTAFAAIVATATQFGTDLTAAFEAAAGGGKEGDGGPIGRFVTSLSNSDIVAQLVVMRKKIVAKINAIFLDDKGDIDFFGLGFALGSALGKVIVSVLNLRTKVVDAINGMFGIGKGQGLLTGISFPGLGEILGAALAVPVIAIEPVRKKIVDAINSIFGEGAQGEASPFAQFAAGFYAGLSKELGLGTVDVAALKASIQKAINNLFSGGGEKGGDLQIVKAQVEGELDLLFGAVTFSDLKGSFDNLVTQVTDTLGVLDWEKDIVSGIFSPLVTAVKNAISGIFSAFDLLQSGDGEGALSKVGATISGLGGDLGKSAAGAINASEKLFQGLDLTEMSAKISTAIFATLATVITNGLTGALKFINTGLQAVGDSSTGQDSLAKQLGNLAGDVIAGVIVGVIAGAVVLLKPENLLATLKASKGVVETLTSVMGEIVVGLADSIKENIEKVVAANETTLQSVSNNIVDSITRFLNNIIEGANKVITLFGGEAIDKIEIPIDLSASQFKVVTPQEIDVSNAFTITGQQLIDGSQLVRINEQEKIILDASAIAQLDPESRLNLPAGSLIDVNGIQKLVVDPNQIFETDTSVSIVLTPDEIIEIDKSSPLPIGSIDLSAANVKVDITEVASSISDRLRSETFQGPEDLTPVSLPIELTVPTPLTPSDVLGGADTLGIQIEFTTSGAGVVDKQALGTPVGTDIAAGVQAGYDAKIAGSLNEGTKGAIDDAAAAAGIKSPSTVADERVGVPIADGVIEGFGRTLTNADLSTPINAFVSKIKDGISAALSGGLSSATSEAVRDSAGGGLTLGAIKASLDLSFGKIKFENLATAFENLKTAIANTIEGLTWEIITPESFDPLANTVNDTLINVSWDNYVKSDTTWDPFAVVVEDTLRTIQWASYITTATWRTLAQRIATTLASIPWASYITVATWTTLAKRIGDTLKAIPWNSYVTVDTWTQLANAVAETLKRIPWANYITASTFTSLAQAVVTAINQSIVQQVGPGDFAGAANAIISAINGAVTLAAVGATPVNPTDPVIPDPPPPPGQPQEPILLAGFQVLSNLMEIADGLRRFQSSSGGSVLPIGSPSVPFGATSMITNSTVSISNEFHLHQTVSEQTAARSGRSFAMFKTLTGSN